jgi:hypothetical protein
MPNQQASLPKVPHQQASLPFSFPRYVMTLGGCPIHWNSKLQTEIKLSMTEAEYIALSQAM